MRLLDVSGMWMLIVIMVCFMGFTMGNGQKISGKIDVVFVASASESVIEMASVKEGWKNQLLDQVEMWKDTKIAVIVYQSGFSGVPEVLVNLTNDRTAVQDGLNRWAVDAVKAQNQMDTLAMIRGQIFDFSRSDRAKVVIVYLRYPYEANGQKAAEILREQGVFLYYIFADLPGIALNHIGSASRIFNVTLEDMFSNKSFDRIPDVISAMTRDLCTFCHFEDIQRDSCKPKTRQPGMKLDYFNDNNSKCSQSQLADVQCNKVDCQTECDRQWPWDEEPNCAVNCGKIGRGRSNPPPNMDNCLSEFECSPCPTMKPALVLIQTTYTATTKIPGAKPTTKSPTLGIGLTIGCLVGGPVFLIVVVVVIVIILKCRSKSAKKAEAEPSSKKVVENIYIELDDRDSAVDSMREIKSMMASVMACKAGRCPRIYVSFSYNPRHFAPPRSTFETKRNLDYETPYFLVGIPPTLVELLKAFNKYEDPVNTDSSVIYWEGHEDDRVPDNCAIVQVTSVAGLQLDQFNENVRKPLNVYLKNEKGETYEHLGMPQNREFLDAILAILNAIEKAKNS